MSEQKSLFPVWISEYDGIAFICAEEETAKKKMDEQLLSFYTRWDWNEAEQCWDGATEGTRYYRVDRVPS